MSDWVEEFGPFYDVPGFIPFLVRKKILKDMSWHNDVSPSFGVRRDNGKSWEVRFWVDHPFKSYRELRAERFTVIVSQDEDPIYESHYDDLEEALLDLFGKLSEWHQGTAPGVLEWRPDSLSRSEWEEPAGYLDELKEEYLSDPRA